MQRPTRLPLLAIAHEYRQPEPVVGDLIAGYALGSPFPNNEGAYFMGYAGDWSAHLDSDRFSIADEWDTAAVPQVSLVSGNGLDFANGGPLVQQPTDGGTYISPTGERIDARNYAEGPGMAFTANTTNYVFLRAPTGAGGRLSYPEHYVDTTSTPVDATWTLVHQVDTNAIQVTNNFTLAGRGYYRKEFNSFTNYSDGAVLFITGSSSFVPNVWIQATGGAALLYLNSTANQAGLQVQSSGYGSYSIFGTVGSQAAFAQMSLSTLDSAGVVFDTFGVQPGNPLCMYPAPVAPAHVGAGPWANYLRMYSVNILSGGMLRWRDGSGTEWTPHAAPGGVLKQATLSGAAPIIGSGAATNLVTLNVAGTIKQNHWYLIRVACEATNNALANFTQLVTISVNGVAVAPYNAYNLIADRDGLQKPWLSTMLFYQHTAADVVNPAIVLGITHGAGASSCQYHSARIAILGSWYF